MQTLEEDFPDVPRQQRVSKKKEPKRSRTRSENRAIPTSGKGTMGRRHHSTGETRMRKKSNLRVKTQAESTKKEGLKKGMGGGRVEFAFLEVREFPMILGDNPACVEGPPVTLDWAHDPQTQFVLDVATFEKLRGQRRTMSQLVLSKSVRERKLINCGFTKQDIAQAIREVRKIKHYRIVSAQQTSMDDVHESMENMTMGIKKLFVFRKSQYERKVEASMSPNDPACA